MKIVLFRIDNRLIHGQVVEGWLPSLDVGEVMVISDTAAKSNLMRKMLRMALPKGYGLNIFNAKEAANYLKEDNEAKVLVLLEDFHALEILAENGILPQVVNVGNTKYEEGKKEYGNGVFLDEKDLSMIKKLQGKNIKFDVRALPSSLSVRLG
ncbi:MAG: PTS sugar transporter subunit IIB [Elusimicrobiota bacterium]|jgi:mannose/fructose/N-acetylgalactosamine-specific phosphotransferase system component IIB|nr:PTS sugar transporter subunit IIB [Elusimicrobiota bacterium]